MNIPSVAPYSVLLVLATGGFVTALGDALWWPLRLVWVVAATIALCRDEVTPLVLIERRGRGAEHG